MSEATMGCIHVTIVEAVNGILAEYDFPLTLRQIYYRLVSVNLIPNKRSAYNQLSKTLVKARENGEVDDVEKKSSSQPHQPTSRFE